MKKVLSIVLSIAMVVCLMPSMAFASADASGTGEVVAKQTFSDIDGERCEGAVNVLNALSVVNGFPDGTFRPGEDVTRAHMAQMITKFLGVDTYANATTSIFSDMDSATWAIPQVEYCAQLGIVKGYGDGRFGPNDLVTYEQAATMIVRAIGFTDDCNEMIAGVWPANYVQKALDLGIFNNTDNGGTTNANRGDVALMMYNALSVPQVYIDNDGVTQYKSGNEGFDGLDGKVFYGTSALTTLNKDGPTPIYEIVNYTDIDGAVYDIHEYFGAVAKVYRDKDNNVLALGDIKTTFLTGTFNKDFDEFTADGKTYSIGDRAVKTFDAPRTAFNVVDGIADLFRNGSYVGVFDETKDLTNIHGLLQKQRITLSCKVSGSTITQIFCANYWDINQAKCDADIADESNLSAITASTPKLLGAEFVKDDEGAADTKTFTLVGVKELSDIGEDDVIVVYSDANDKVRRVEVGTERVEGTLDAFSTGTVKADDTWGTPSTATIDGAAYKTTYLNIPAGDPDDLVDLEDWCWDGEGDGAAVGDVIKVYLDADGAVFKAEMSEAGNSSYAMVLDYDIQEYNDDKTEIYNGAGLNGDNSVVSLLTANGSVYTFYFKNGATIVYDKETVEDNTGIRVGDIVTYNLNSSNRIKEIREKGRNYIPKAIADNKLSIVGDTATLISTEKGGVAPEHNVSKKGYWGDEGFAENATIFSVDQLTERNSGNAQGTEGSPNWYIDDEDAAVVSYANMKGVDDVIAYGTYTKTSNNKLVAFVADGSAVSSSKTFGFITGWTSLGSDHSSGCDYQVTVLVDGESKTYFYDASSPFFDLKKVFAQIKFNASGNISELDFANQDVVDAIDRSGFENIAKDKDLILVGWSVADANGIDFKSGSVWVDSEGGYISVDSDARYYEWKAGSGNVANSSKSDVTNCDANNYVMFYSIAMDGDDADGVIDVVYLAKSRANAILNGANAPAPVVEQINKVSLLLDSPLGQTADAINIFDVLDADPPVGYEIDAVKVENLTEGDSQAIIEAGNVLDYAIALKEGAGYAFANNAKAEIAFDDAIAEMSEPVFDVENGIITFTMTV